MPKNLNLPQKRIFIGNATIWKRVAAFILDILIIDFFLFSSYETILRNLTKGSSGFIKTYTYLHSNSSTASVLFLIFMILTLFTLAYFILMEYMLGQTPGKILLNLKVLSVVDEKNLALPNFWQCLLRTIFIIPTIPFILLWVIDPLYLLFTKDGQRLTELLSKTKVIEVYAL